MNTPVTKRQLINSFVYECLETEIVMMDECLFLPEEHKEQDLWNRIHHLQDTAGIVREITHNLIEGKDYSEQLGRLIDRSALPPVLKEVLI